GTPRRLADDPAAGCGRRWWTERPRRRGAWRSSAVTRAGMPREVVVWCLKQPNGPSLEEMVVTCDWHFLQVGRPLGGSSRSVASGGRRRLWAPVVGGNSPPDSGGAFLRRTRWSADRSPPVAAGPAAGDGTASGAGALEE